MQCLMPRPRHLALKVTWEKVKYLYEFKGLGFLSGDSGHVPFFRSAADEEFHKLEEKTLIPLMLAWGWSWILNPAPTYLQHCQALIFKEIGVRMDLELTLNYSSANGNWDCCWQFVFYASAYFITALRKYDFIEMSCWTTTAEKLRRRAAFSI